jgi:hypothetical protein
MYPIVEVQAAERFERLRYHFGMNARSKHHDGESGLVPHGLDYGATAPFVNYSLFALAMLEDEPSVEQYGRANPDARRAIYALSGAVGRTGRRVRESGQNSKADFQYENLKLYTAEEIWMFDLAIDVVAMLTTGGGLGQDNRMMVQDHLRWADKDTHSSHWKREVHKAGDGPPEFRELRAHVPHRRS